MGDVIQKFPKILPAYEAKSDLGSLPEYASEKKAIAPEWNDITDVVSSLGFAAKLHALVAALARPAAGINGKAFRFTGQDPTTGLGTISTSLATDLNKAFAAAIEKIEQGGDLDGTA